MLKRIVSGLYEDRRLYTSPPVKVLCLNSKSTNIFGEANRQVWFEGKGVEFVDRWNQANVIVADQYSRVTPLRRLLLQIWHRKRLKFLLWTTEPRDNTFTVNKVSGRGIIPDLHIMNCYTGDIFTDNYHFCRWAMCRWPRATELTGKDSLVNRKIVAMQKYVSTPQENSLKIHGKEADLSWLRCQIALEGHKRGLVDIYGTGWPPGISTEDSRKVGDWMQRKLDILKNYGFNLCFENTICPHYCTEKIWNAIAGGCLPIYYGSGTRIYDDFPRNSFLDYSELGSPEALFERILSMPEEEYRLRYNLCAQTYNRIYDSDVMKDNETPAKTTAYRLHVM